MKSHFETIRELFDKILWDSIFSPIMNMMLKRILPFWIIFMVLVSWGISASAACNGLCDHLANNFVAFDNCITEKDRAGQCLECTGPCPGGGTPQNLNGQCGCIGGAEETSSNFGGSCLSTFEGLVQKCHQETVSAQNSCDEKKDQGVSNVTDDMVNMALMIGQQTGSSLHAACSKMANVSQAANAAVAAYRMNCSNAISSCNSACAAATQYVQSNGDCVLSGAGIEVQHLSANAKQNLLTRRLDSVTEQSHVCRSLTAKTEEASKAIQNYVATSANATQCASLTSGTGDLTQFCAANPTSPLCSKEKIDCSHPSMASNKVCICQNNPTSTDCLTAKTVNPAAPPNYTGGGTDYSSRMPGSDTDFGDVPNLPDIAMGNAPNGGGGASLDGNQGSGAGLSGGGGGGNGGAAAGSEGEGSQGSQRSTDVNAGFYGGGNTAGNFKAGGGGRGGNMGAPGAGGGQASKPGSPDLRQFLPSGANDPRRRAMGLSGQDGITGPHSNIWRKIKNRYQVVKPTLLP